MRLSFVLVGIVLAAMLVLTLLPREYDWSQRNFPCQEDELLGYAPQFGADRVGCIHRDEFIREVR